MKTEHIVSQAKNVIAESRLREILSDGKKHDFTFLTAIFIDGHSVDIGSMKPFGINGKVRTFEEFEHLVEASSSALLATGKDDSLITRALGFALLEVSRKLLSHPDNPPREAICDLFEIAGAALGLEANGINVDNAISLPDEFTARFKKFIPDGAE